MPDLWIIVILVALVVAIVLVALALGRLSTLVTARNDAVREATELRTRLEVLVVANADSARSLRQDLANARTEQGTGAQAARTELGATLAQHAHTMQQQLGGMAAAQNEQMKHFGDRLQQLTQASEERLAAVRDTVEVPPLGKVAVVFDAENPGRWMLHCHNGYHLDTGMITEIAYDPTT